MATDKKRMGPRGALIAVIVMAGLLAMFIACVNALSNSVQNIERMPDISASIEAAPDGLRITNNNDYDWQDITLRLNGSYEKHWRIIDAGATLKLGWRAFVDDEGFVFSPYAQRPQELLIRIREPHIESKSFTWR